MIIFPIIVMVCGVLRGILAIVHHECSWDLWLWCFIAAAWALTAGLMYKKVK